MKHIADRRECDFRITDIVLIAVACAMLAALLAPALAQSRENDARQRCLDNAKRVLRAVHQYYEATRMMPLASTQLLSAKPAHFGDADAAGYSWLVRVSPFLEWKDWDLLNFKSSKLQKDLYDPAVTSATDGEDVVSRTSPRHFSLCPSFIDKWRHENNADAASSLPAISNFHVIAGTHFANKAGMGRLLPADKLTSTPDGRLVPTESYEGNGVLVFPGMSNGKLTNRGFRFDDIRDGAAATLLFGETVEQQFARWMDGQATWLVAAWPSNPDLPTEIPVPHTRDMGLGWTDAQLRNNFLSLGKRGTQGEAGSKDIYLPAARWSGAADRVWGPSSFHDGVTHGFADMHAKLLSTDIDKNVYLRLVTRNGREVQPENIYGGDGLNTLGPAATNNGQRRLPGTDATAKPASDASSDEQLASGRSVAINGLWESFQACSSCRCDQG